MPKKHYVIKTQEGADFASRWLNALHEVDEEVMLSLEGVDQERALLAAGWLEESAKKGKKEG